MGVMRRGVEKEFPLQHGKSLGEGGGLSHFHFMSPLPTKKKVMEQVKGCQTSGADPAGQGIVMKFGVHLSTTMGG